MKRHAIAAVVLSLLAAPALALPPALSDIPLKQALTQNIHGDSYLVIKFTADWCGPCKKMDKTTWSDQTVVAWLAEHKTTAIAVDIDEGIGKKLAARYKILSIPTMVLFKGGDEVDRISGYTDSDKFIGWLEGATGDGQAPVDVHEQIGRAQQLVWNDKFEEATEVYAWLWEHMLEHDKATEMLRIPYVAEEIGALCAKHEPARVLFFELRFAAETKLAEGQRTKRNLSDWLAINLLILDEQKSVLDWIARIEDRPTAIKTMRQVRGLLGDFLLEHDRWDLYGQTEPPARMTFEMSKQMYTMMSTSEMVQENTEMKANMEQQFVKGQSTIHAALLAADRDDEAWFVAEGLLTIIDTPAAQTALLETALKADQVHARHIELASGADTAMLDRCRQQLAARADGSDG